MNTRRTFLKTAAAAVVCSKAGERSVAPASDGKPVLVRDARVIRVRDRKGGATESYLKVTSESGLSGFAGPLLSEQVAAFPANLRALLVGRDVADPETLNFTTLWAPMPPRPPPRTLRRGERPAHRRDGMGHRAHHAAHRNRLADHGPERHRPGPLGPARQGGGAARLAPPRGNPPASERVRQHAGLLGQAGRGEQRRPASSSTRGSSDRSGSS